MMDLEGTRPQLRASPAYFQYSKLAAYSIDFYTLTNWFCAILRLQRPCSTYTEQRQD